jgi:hypothetical protein
MKTYQPLKVVNALMGQEVGLNDRCCGESGTFAASRPDIATQVRYRKEEEMRKGAAKVRSEGFNGEVKVLTKYLKGLQSCRISFARQIADDGAGHIRRSVGKLPTGGEI